MHTVKVDSRFEDVRIAREPHRRQITAIGAAPDADAFRIDAGLLLQETRAGRDILIFGRAGRAPAIGLMKRATVTDTQTIVYRQHDEAMRSEILIHGIGIAVIAHVMPAQQHLPRRPAMHEYDAGLCPAVFWPAEDLS